MAITIVAGADTAWPRQLLELDQANREQTKTMSWHRQHPLQVTAKKTFRVMITTLSMTTMRTKMQTKSSITTQTRICMKDVHSLAQMIACHRSSDYRWTWVRTRTLPCTRWTNRWEQIIPLRTAKSRVVVPLYTPKIRANPLTKVKGQVFCRLQVHNQRPRQIQTQRRDS